MDLAKDHDKMEWSVVNAPNANELGTLLDRYRRVRLVL